MTAVLDVQGLTVEFPTRRGTLTAVDHISFSIGEGEVLGVVGESGAGKSLTGTAVIGLLEPPGRIAAGEVRLAGKRIDNLAYEELRRIRGREIGMVFQDPLTSLNPLYTVGRQLMETIRTHTDMGEKAARDRAIEMLAEVGIPEPRRRIEVQNPELAKRLEGTLADLQRLQGRQIEQLSLDLEKQLETVKRGRFEQRSRDIHRVFDDYRRWVEDTLTTEPQPWIQVLAAVCNPSATAAVAGA